MGVPHVPGRERDYWYATFDIDETRRFINNGWPAIEMTCSQWEENAAGERRLIERRSRWIYFGTESVINHYEEPATEVMIDDADYERPVR